MVSRSRRSSFSRCSPEVRNNVPRSSGCIPTLVDVSTNVGMHPDERGTLFRTSGLQRLKEERRDLETIRAALVGDLVHLHQTGTRRAPRLIGRRLVLEIPLEVAPRA